MATILKVPQGGTGAATLSGIVKGSGTGALTAITLAGDTTKFLNEAGAFAVPVVSSSIGGTITSGTAGSVLFVNPASTLAQDNANFYYDDTNNQLRLGSSTQFTGTSNTPLTIGGTLNTYLETYLQNKSTGDTASGDYVIGADNDNSSYAGHYIDTGINGSGYLGTTAALGIVKSVSVNTAGTGYAVGNVLTLVGGTNDCTVTVATVSAGAILTVSLTTNGTNYTVTNFAVTGGTGTGARINILTLFDFSGFLANDGYLYTAGGNMIIGSDDTLANKSIKFFTGGTATANERMRIDSTGNVGMGILVPTVPLHLYRDTNAGGNPIILISVANGDSSVLRLSNSEGYTSFVENNDVFYIQKAAGYLFSFNSLGNTGLGLASGVSGKLHISDLYNAGSGSLANPALNIEQTWNTTGSPTAIKLTVTNTSSGTLSNLMDLQVGGVSKFTINKSGFVGIESSIPTHSLTLGSTSTGIVLYNTADQVTNYERLQIYNNSNVFTIQGQKGGTGVNRNMRIGTVSRVILIDDSGASGGFYVFSNSTGGSADVLAITTTRSNSTGNPVEFKINPTITQTSTAGYTALLINPTESTIGTGNRYLMDLQVGGTSRLAMMSDGYLGIGMSTKIPMLGVTGKAAFTGTGTVSTTVSSTTLTGSGTKFLSELAIGDKVIINAIETRVIKSITSDTSATLVINSGATNNQAAVAFTITKSLQTTISSNGVPRFIIRPDGGIVSNTSAAIPDFDAGGATHAGIFTDSSNNQLIIQDSSGSGEARIGFISSISSGGGTGAGAVVGIRNNNIVSGYGKMVIRAVGTATLDMITASGYQRGIGLGNITTKLSTVSAQPFANVTGTGTVTNSAGGTTVTGTSTFFTLQFAVGDRITVNGETVSISAIASDTSLTVATVIVGANTAVAFTVIKSMLTLLNTSSTTKFVVNDLGYVGVDTAAPHSTVHVSGSFATAYVAKTATYTATASDYTIDCTSGTFTVTLPTAVGITGRKYVIKNSGVGVITVGTTSSQTIDGVTTQSLSTQYQRYTVQSNGANWIII